MDGCPDAGRPSPRRLPRLPGHQRVLGRHPHVLEVQRAQVVGAQAHGVEPLTDLEALHPLLQDQRDVAVLAVDLAAGEGRQHVGARAVADVALVPVEQVRAVGDIFEIVRGNLTACPQ